MHELIRPEAIRLGASGGMHVLTSLTAIMSAVARRTREAVDHILFSTSESGTWSRVGKDLLPVLSASSAPVRGVWTPDPLNRSEATALPSDLTHLAASGGLRWSTRSAPPCIVWDSQSALVALDQADVTHGAMLIEVPTIVALAHDAVQQHWRESMRWPDPNETPVTIAAHRRRVVLALLAEGKSDEMIARELDVNPRTVQRIVCKLKASLGVGSRYELGVAAAKLGLAHLPEPDDEEIRRRTRRPYNPHKHRRPDPTP